MAYCHEKAIPHSEYLSRWTEEDRAKNAAYILEKADRCQMCGTAPWEWAEDRHAYTALTTVCRGCQQKDLVREGLEKNEPGVSVALFPKAVATTILERQAAVERSRSRKPKESSSV